MPYSLRTFARPGKFCQELTLDALGRAIPQEAVAAALRETGAVARRERKLTLAVVVWALIAMHLYPALSMGHTLKKIAQGLRYVWPDPAHPVPGASALSYRRYQLGARPLAALFRRACRPLATPATPGAYRFGLRLLALDGAVERVPDTPANARYCGRQRGDRGDSAFPQVRAVVLCECGTHAILDAGFWPYRVAETVGGDRLLRSVGPGDLLLWDANFHSHARLARTLARGAHALGRLPAPVRPRPLRALPDGSTLATLRPPRDAPPGTPPLPVRVVAYTVTDPALPGHGEERRVVTTLLDHTLAPARDLVCAYHERWEVELVVAEVETRQRPADAPLRSEKPVGVIQELYALLLAHYAVRALMHEAARAAGLDPDRLSFVHALRLIHAAIPEFQQAAPADHPHLYARLLRDLAAAPLPPRRARTNPRVVKRKMPPFGRKRPEHRRWPQPARPFDQCIALI